MLQERKHQNKQNGWDNHVICGRKIKLNKKKIEGGETQMNQELYNKLNSSRHNSTLKKFDHSKSSFNNLLNVEVEILITC